jgi:Fe-S-cluster containining protein
MSEASRCRQCGTCCRKGGPAFHLSDRSLIDGGKIPARDLFTIRSGEPAFENVQGRLQPAATDIIKIKGKPDSWECVFLDGETNRCGIYAHRPVECRALQCQDPSELKKIYRRERLTRKDLLHQVTDLWALVTDHQRRCDYALLLDLAARGTGRPSDRAARRQLMEIISFDTQLRRLIAEQEGMDEGLTDFLFGRPLSQTLPPLGIPVRQQEVN